MHHPLYSSFIHSAISIAPLQVLYYSQALPTTARILYRSFTPKHTATVGKGLAQGPYMAARAGVEPTTLRLKAIDSTKAPPCPNTMHHPLYSTIQWVTLFIVQYNASPSVFSVPLSNNRNGCDFATS